MNFREGRAPRIMAVLFVITFLSAGSLHSVIKHTHNDASYVNEVADSGHCHEGDNTFSESALWSFIHCSLAHDTKKTIALLPSQFVHKPVAIVTQEVTSFFVVHPLSHLDSYERQLSRGVFAYTRFG